MQMRIKQALRRTYSSIDPINIALYRLLHPRSGPIPPAANRWRVGSRSISRFMDAGRNCFEPILRAMNDYGVPREPRCPVLDFGCGVGRVLQYFRPLGFSLYGCDVDDSAIRYLAGAYPEVHAKVSAYAPPLPYEDGRFAFVYSVSVWTHLPPELQEPWLVEVKRVLRPGGLALLTTIGPYGYRKGTHLQAVRFSYDTLMKAGFQYNEYNVPNASPGASPSYGAAYHTPDYIRAHWSRVFTVLDVQEGAIDDLNDLVVLQKT